MKTRLRRYPALGFLAVAALLASLLPSALRVPLSGPTASAELAPVPGKSDSAQGDLSALGQTSTGGLGSGAGIGGTGAGGPGPRGLLEPDAGEAPPPPGSGRNLANKRCVGKPARQTEDPLSPACVAYFKGDNFGATSKGVTRDEIVVVIVTRCNTDGSFAVIDYEDPAHASDQNAAYVRYFNERFQTYDRRVHLYGISPSSVATSCSKAAIQNIAQRLRPFYMVIGNTSADVVEEAVRLGIMATNEFTSPRDVMHRSAPYFVGYTHDLEDGIANYVESVCARLAGRPARFAPDPTLQGRTRKFGLYYRNISDSTGLGARLIVDGIRDRCGATAGEVYVASVNESPSAARTFDTLARMRSEGVTTVLGVGTLTLAAAAQADSMKWYPEWYLFGEFVGWNGIRPYPPTVMRGVFGLMGRRRVGAPAEHHHRQAYAEGCPGCTTDTLGPFAYDELLLLFTGIQAAGPRLTPANFDRGMRALPARQSRDPFAPSAYFAPGNHTFLKDFAVAWWDATGLPPGTSTPGCWRLVEDGLRYRADDWRTRPGDEGIHGEGQACQGDM